MNDNILCHYSFCIHLTNRKASKSKCDLVVLKANPLTPAVLKSMTLCQILSNMKGFQHLLSHMKYKSKNKGEMHCIEREPDFIVAVSQILWQLIQGPELADGLKVLQVTSKRLLSHALTVQ